MDDAPMVVRSAALLLLALLALVPRVTHAWCVGGAPPARDADGDGLNDIQEQFFGTDPSDADSDDDGTLDGEEDADGDGILDQDEPTLFSLELFEDVFASRGKRFGIVLEGTNLFDPARGQNRAVVDALGADRARLARPDKLNGRTRVYLRMSPSQAKSFLGEALDRAISVRTPDGTSPVFHPMYMPCMPGPPKLMAAAIIEFRTRTLGSPLRYVVIGGCNLLDKERKRVASTTVRLADHDIPLRAQYGGVGMLPTRIFIPKRSRAKADPSYPFFPDLIDQGDQIRVVTSQGVSNAVPVDPVIAQHRIPTSHLVEDHDHDGVSTQRELQLDTDPLVWDTDGDGLSDGAEVIRGTDPRDRDSDGDGILDGAE